MDKIKIERGHLVIKFNQLSNKPPKKLKKNQVNLTVILHNLHQKITLIRI